MMFSKNLALLNLLILLLSCHSQPFRSPADSDRQSESLQGKLSEESEGIGGYSLHCFALSALDNENSELSSYACRLSETSNGRKIELGKYASSWSWGVDPVWESQVSIRDLQDSDPQWHVIYDFSKIASEAGDDHLHSKISLRLQWKDDSSEELVEASLQDLLLPDGEIEPEHLLRTEDGIVFIISFDEQKADARVFARVNGIQDLAVDMNEVDLGNGRFSYSFFRSSSTFRPSDLIEFRFYTADFAGVQVFTPGPGEDLWFGPFSL